MKCFKCNAELTDRDFCASCGTNVSVYKKILRTSNAYYNDGLAKAKVRDLTGAAESLRRSVKYNKNNTDARNLLGLVYYECGDMAHALAEWVISRSLQERGNPASQYLGEIQGNAGSLERARRAVEKYNMAVHYARTNSEDLAVIQLKKVLTLNTKMLPAHHLLSLLYMKRGDYTKAKKILRKAQQIDTNNTTTLLYLREVDRLYATGRGNPENLQSTGTNRDRITYQSGNDTVIQPTSYKDSSGIWTVVNLLIGVAIGLLAAWFLILPSQRNAIQEEYRQREQELYAKLERDASPSETPGQAATESPEPSPTPEAGASQSPAPGQSENPRASQSPAPGQSEDPHASKAPETEKPDPEIYGDPDDMQLDDSMTAEDYFSRGSEWYDYGDYEDAISNLQKALALDDTHLMSLYYLGRAYQQLEDSEKAIAVYERIIALYPDNELAGDARRFIGQLQ